MSDDRGWRPIITTEEWGNHLRAQFRVFTDRVKSALSFGDEVAALNSQLQPLPAAARPVAFIDPGSSDDLSTVQSGGIQDLADSMAASLRPIGLPDERFDENRFLPEQAPGQIPMAPGAAAVPPWERPPVPMSRTQAHAGGLQAAQEHAQAERDLGRQRMAERRQAADEYAFYGAQDDRDRRTLDTAMRIPILGGILRAGMGLEKRVGTIEEQAGAASTSMTRPGASAVDRAVGALGLAGTAFGTPGSLAAGMAEGAGASPAAAEVVGAAVNFASPFGGVSTLANLREMGTVGRTVIPLLSSTVAVGAGTKAYWESKDAGDDDHTAWLKAIAAAINAGDAALGVTEFGRAGALGLRDAAANVVGKGITADVARGLNRGLDNATDASRAGALMPEPVGFVQTGRRGVPTTGSALEDWSDTTFIQALTDPQKRSVLLRAAAGNPTRAEEVTGQVGTVAGGVAGAASGPADQSWQERVGRGFVGALAGSQAGMRFPRLVNAITGAAREVRQGDRLGIISDVIGTPAVDASGRMLSRQERIRAGGQRDVPFPKLSGQGEALRQSLIEQNVRLGMPLDAATELIDGYITTLARGGNIPEAYLLPPQQRSLFWRANDTLGTYSRAMMLLSPLTHLRNITSTAATMPWQVVQGLVAPAIEPLWRGLGKSPEPRYLGEVAPMVKGWAHGGMAAVRNFVDTLAHGDEALEMAQTGRAATGGVEKAIGTLLRPLSATDAFFTTLYESGEAYKLAYRASRQSGLKGAAANADMLRRLQTMHQDPAMMAAVEKAGKYNTYRSDPDAIGELFGRIGRTPGIGPFILPFSRTPWAATKYDAERSGLGWASVAAGALKKGTTSGEMADRSARALAGSLIGYGLYRYAEEGNVTAGWPESQTEREAWVAEGKKPWHIKIGDSWWNYGVIPGLNANVATAALLAQARKQGMEGKAWDAVAVRLGMELVSVLAQKPLLDNLAGLMEAIDRPQLAEKFWERFKGQVGSTLLPGSSLLGYAENVTDEYQRDAETAPERVQSRIPAAIGAASGGRIPDAQDLPVRTDAFGNELRRDQTGWEAALNPFRRSTAREGIRRYRGSESAEMDTEIQRALEAVRNFERDRRQYPAPTAEQRALARRFEGRENDRWTELRARERERQRREAVARGR